MALYRRLMPPPAAGCFFLVALLGIFNPILRWCALVSGDSYLHVRIGQEILRTGHLPATDFLSFTHFGAPYLAHEWLFEVGLALLYRVFAQDAFVFFSAVAVAALCALLVMQTVRRGANPAGTGLALFQFLFFLLPMYRARPHLITALGFGIGSLVLSGTLWRRRDWRVLAAFAASFAVWTSFHTGSMIFLGILAVEVGADAWQAARGKTSWSDPGWTLAVLAAACAGALATPNGIRVPLQVLAFMATPGFNVSIEEHRALDFSAPLGISFLVLAATLTAFVVARRQRLRLAEILEIIFLGMLAVYSRRNTLLFAITSFGVASLAMSELAGKISMLRNWKFAGAPGRTLVAVAWIGGTLLLITICLFARAQPISAQDYRLHPLHPAQAVQFIKEHLSQFGQRMYNTYDFGGYLALELPERKVFVDGRADFYGFEFTRQAIRIRRGEPDARAALDEWKVDWVIIRGTDGLAGLLTAPAWSQVYRDEVAAVYQRGAGAM